MNGSDDHKASDNGATIWFMAVIILCIVSSCTVYAPRIVQDSTQPVAGRPITTVSVLQSGDSVQILRTDSLSMVRSVAGRVKQVAGDTVYVRQASSDSLITIRKSDRVTLIEQLSFFDVLVETLGGIAFATLVVLVSLSVIYLVYLLVSAITD